MAISTLAPGIRWREHLAGRIDWSGGGADHSELELALTIDVDDLAALRHDRTSPAGISGTVRLSVLGDEPLAVTGGRFQLSVTDAGRVDTRRMTYRIDARHPDGELLRIDGYKVLHDDDGHDAWHDLTTLVVEIHREDGSVVGRGAVRIDPVGVAELVRTLTAVRAPSAAAAVRLRLDFLRLFGGEVGLRYGKAFASVAEFQVSPPKQNGRRLLPPPHEQWFVDGHRWVDGDPGDGYVSLKLTRFRGGDKGPVMLAPGFAMAARSFALETTEQNLTEHLFAAGYDVWLFDYRASIDLPSSVRSPFTLDDVARADWPTAVSEVRRRTGADTVQIVGHCMGSTTALMALASGMGGVRAVVCSQNTLHLHMLPFSRFKARSRLANLLQGAGYERVTAPRSGRRPSPSALALDLLYRLNPLRRGERCSSPMCRWAFAYFGPTHRHAQLDEATHLALRTEFGPAGLDALAHIAAMARRREAVTTSGEPYFDERRLRVPTLFLAGEHNRIFLPTGARRTYDLLRAANPDVPYRFERLEGYAHLDGIVGRDAHREVFPIIRRHLDEHQQGASRT
jgi:cholesterol oxidase